jgi:iron complex outermembrane receptor protein
VTITRILLCSLVVILSTSDASAQRSGRAGNLSQLSLEELFNVRIISVGRKEQLVGETAAAVYVLTQNDIRRSGIRTLAELLRLVPGMHVARANSGAWATGVRGFSNVYADKLLVLIDGRSIYNRSFSGVFWDMEDLLVDDIDHIEVIRGAGGAQWGANAVSGVINVITKSSDDTQGVLIRVGAGTFDRLQASARYGGALGRATYRMSSQWSAHGQSRLDANESANDSWTTLGNSGRVDWKEGVNTVMIQGRVMTSRVRPMWLLLTGPTSSGRSIGKPSDRSNASVLAQWTHRDSGGGSLQVQSFFTRLLMAEASVTESERIGDVEAQYRKALGTHHDVVFGGGYRHGLTTTSNSTFSYAIRPERATSGVANVFAQDEIKIGTRLRTTLGLKVERETFSGWNVQPTARALWTMSPSQHVWAGVSRAVRTPSGSDRGLDLKFAAFTGPDGVPIVMGVSGNPAYRAETVWDQQVGYRFTAGTRLAVDVSAFRGRYRGLQTTEPMPPVFNTTPDADYLYLGSRFDNLLDADTSGIELSGRWTVTDSWLLNGSYSGFHVTSRVSPLSRDGGAGAGLKNTPAHQWQAHSTAQLGPRAELTFGLFHVGRLEGLDSPAYLRTDANLELRASDRFSIIVNGQNLLTREHAEFPSPSIGMVTTLVPRSASVQLVWSK